MLYQGKHCEEMEERDVKIIDLYENGYEVEYIAKRYGMSPGGIRQRIVIARRGVDVMIPRERDLFRKMRDYDVRESQLEKYGLHSRCRDCQNRCQCEVPQYNAPNSILVYCKDHKS